MNTLLTILMTVLFLSFVTDPVFAGNDYGHGYGGGYNSHGYGGGYNAHGYSGNESVHNGDSRHENYRHDRDDDRYINGWGAAVMGNAIINSHPRERDTGIEHRAYHDSDSPPPQEYREDCDDCPDGSYTHHPIWVSGHYFYDAEGIRRYVPGHWEE
jgi:hypothetical protein